MAAAFELDKTFSLNFAIVEANHEIAKLSNDYPLDKKLYDQYTTVLERIYLNLTFKVLLETGGEWD